MGSQWIRSVHSTDFTEVLCVHTTSKKPVTRSAFTLWPHVPQTPPNILRPSGCSATLSDVAGSNVKTVSDSDSGTAAVEISELIRLLEVLMKWYLRVGLESVPQSVISTLLSGHIGVMLTRSHILVKPESHVQVIQITLLHSTLSAQNVRLLHLPPLSDFATQFTASPQETHRQVLTRTLFS